MIHPKKPDCERAQHWMMDRLYGTLSEMKAHQLDTHLEQCESCASEWESVQASRQLLSNLGDGFLSAELDKKVMKAAHQTETRPPKTFISWPRLAAAASFVVIALVSVQVWIEQPMIDQGSNSMFFDARGDESKIESAPMDDAIAYQEKKRDVIQSTKQAMKEAPGRLAPMLASADKTKSRKPRQTLMASPSAPVPVVNPAVARNAEPEESATNAEELFRTGLTLYNSAFTKLGDDRKTLLKSAILILDDIAERYPTEEEWVSMGLILIADSYRVLDDPVQAVATYRKMLDSFPEQVSYCKQSRKSMLELMVEHEEMVHHAGAELTVYANKYGFDAGFLNFVLTYSDKVQSSSPEETFYWSNEIARHTNQYDPLYTKAQTLINDTKGILRQKAHIHKWLMRGPMKITNFPTKDHMTEIAGSFPEFGPNVALSNQHWTYIPTQYYSHYFGRYNIGKMGTSTFAKTSVYSPTSRMTNFEVTGSDGLRIWLNGNLHWKYTHNDKSTDFEEIFEAKLKQGWNDIFVKVNHLDNHGHQILKLLITDTTGEIIPDLIIDPTKQAQTTDVLR